MLNVAERALLSDLIRRADRAGMSVWAYAVHTGNASLMRLSSIYRAIYDHDYCMQALCRSARGTFTVHMHD